MTPRDALRQKLREQRERRTTGADRQQVARTVRADPTTALLSMGVDDPKVLQLGKAIAADPKAALRTLSAGKRSAQPADDPDDEAPPPET